MDRDAAVSYVHKLLATMLEKKASDLYVTAEAAPSAKISSEMLPLTNQPLNEQTARMLVRAMLSESVIGIISQTLCKLKDGSGRVAAHEIMLGTAAVRNLIRENKIAQMRSAMQTGQSDGMQTLDQSLKNLVMKGLVDREAARRKADNPDSI